MGSMRQSGGRGARGAGQPLERRCLATSAPAKVLWPTSRCGSLCLRRAAGQPPSSRTVVAGGDVAGRPKLGTMARSARACPLPLGRGTCPASISPGQQAASRAPAPERIASGSTREGAQRKPTCEPASIASRVKLRSTGQCAQSACLEYVPRVSAPSAPSAWPQCGPRVCAPLWSVLQTFSDPQAYSGVAQLGLRNDEGRANSWDAGRGLPNSGRICSSLPNPGRLRPKSGPHRLTLVQLAPNLPAFWTTSTNIGIRVDFRPNLGVGQLRPNLAGVDQIWPDFGAILAEIGQIRPTMN